MPTNFSYGWGYVTTQNTPNHIIGRVLTLVELLGLREEQEKSLKELVRQEVWNAFYDSVSIPPSLNDSIRETYENFKKEVKGNHPGVFTEQDKLSVCIG